MPSSFPCCAHCQVFVLLFSVSLRVMALRPRALLFVLLYAEGRAAFSSDFLGTSLECRYAYMSIHLLLLHTYDQVVVSITNGCREQPHFEPGTVAAESAPPYLSCCCSKTNQPLDPIRTTSGATNNPANGYSNYRSFLTDLRNQSRPGSTLTLQFHTAK